MTTYSNGDHPNRPRPAQASPGEQPLASQGAGTDTRLATKNTINNFIMQTFIINPDTKQPVTIDEWRKDSNPKRANLVLLDFDSYKLLMAKNHSEKEYNWQDANKYAAEFTADGFSGFRLRTRKENIDIYDCRFLGQLDDALKLIGGNANRGWSWGCERDTDPAYSDQVAWIFGGYYGNALSYYFGNSFLAVPVALYPSEAKDK